MKKIASFVALAGLAVCAHADDFVNGSFETGDFTGWDVTQAASGSFLWDYSNPAGFTPTDGTWVAYFGDVSQQYDTISQTLATDAGRHYTLSFDLSNIGATTQWQSFQVKWDGAFLFNGPAPDSNNSVMHHFSYDVVGTGSDTASFAGYAFWAGTGLDDVKLTAAAPVPEPASILAISGGLLAFLRRRKAK